MNPYLVLTVNQAYPSGTGPTIVNPQTCGVETRRIKARVQRGSAHTEQSQVDGAPSAEAARAAGSAAFGAVAQK